MHVKSAVPGLLCIFKRAEGFENGLKRKGETLREKFRLQQPRGSTDSEETDHGNASPFAKNSMDAKVHLRTSDAVTLLLPIGA